MFSCFPVSRFSNSGSCRFFFCFTLSELNRPARLPTFPRTGRNTPLSTYFNTVNQEHREITERGSASQLASQLVDSVGGLRNISGKTVRFCSHVRFGLYSGLPCASVSKCATKPRLRGYIKQSTPHISTFPPSSHRPAPPRF